MSKWAVQLGLGLLIAVALLKVLPSTSGYDMAEAQALAPAPAAPPSDDVPVVTTLPPLAASPASVADIALANPPGPIRPVYTTASPAPPLTSSTQMLVQTQPSLDPSVNKLFAQSNITTSQKVVLPRPPARLEAPPMAQGLSSMSAIVGMDI